jgi:hypothetical protein
MSCASVRVYKPMTIFYNRTITRRVGRSPRSDAIFRIFGEGLIQMLVPAEKFLVRFLHVDDPVAVQVL